MPPKLGQVVETVLYTTSVPKLAEWYGTTLDIRPFAYSPNFAAFSLPNNTILLLFDRRTSIEAKTIPGGSIPAHGAENTQGQHIAFGCDGIEGLDEWEAHLKAQGVELEGRMTWERGGKSIFFRDLEGHLLEIMTKGVWQVY
jgi:catechol 2,3-dioxygenase-like lactoylglutathione lyase family enzyme